MRVGVILSGGNVDLSSYFTALRVDIAEIAARTRQSGDLCVVAARCDRSHAAASAVVPAALGATASGRRRPAAVAAHATSRARRPRYPDCHGVRGARVDVRMVLFSALFRSFWRRAGRLDGHQARRRDGQPGDGRPDLLGDGFCLRSAVDRVRPASGVASGPSVAADAALSGSRRNRRRGT